MASIRKRGPYQWQVKIQRKGWEPQSKTFESEEDAKKWARMIEGEMDRGIFVSRVEAEKTTLAEALKRYKKEITPRKKGADQENYRIDSSLGARFLAGIRSADIAQYRDKRLAAGISPFTINNEFILLSNLFSVAAKEWGMESLPNPVSNVSRPKLPAGRDRRLELGEEERLMVHLGRTMKPLVILALETAMRRGELLALRWVHVDQVRRVAHLPETKNGTSRNVPLSTLAVKSFKLRPSALRSETKS